MCSATSVRIVTVSFYRFSWEMVFCLCTQSSVFGRHHSIVALHQTYYTINGRRTFRIPLNIISSPFSCPLSLVRLKLFLTLWITCFRTSFFFFVSIFSSSSSVAISWNDETGQKYKWEITVHYDQITLHHDIHTHTHTTQTIHTSTVSVLVHFLFYLFRLLFWKNNSILTIHN